MLAIISIFAALIMNETEPEPELPQTSPLYIYAVNAGYKDADSAQNYDFIELRSSEEALPLAGFSLIYTNSSGSEKQIALPQNAKMKDSRLLLGF